MKLLLARAQKQRLSTSTPRRTRPLKSFWLEEHNQSTYRYVTGKSDVEDIIRSSETKSGFLEELTPAGTS